MPESSSKPRLTPTDSWPGDWTTYATFPEPVYTLRWLLAEARWYADQWRGPDDFGTRPKWAFPWEPSSNA
jgi:hypothetical protein